jgi:tetratricopeptide (TPR) repeat protein/predicted Ser/Thr protein kinase
MDADRSRRISRLYHEALERTLDQRDSFLDASCQGDGDLRAEVVSLLAGEASAASLLTKRAAGAINAPPTQNSERLHLELGPGVKLGTYQIEGPLGRGGMGVVFLAHDTILHRQVALKVLGAPADNGNARLRLLHEARNVAALNHPNICTVYEVGEADGWAFIAMEYVEGRPLSDHLAESALPLAEAMRYGIEAADALAYAHDHGVIHRDLKSANAIVTTTGRLKLVDFGLARREDARLADATTMPSLAPAGLVVGTPYSMAPEQVRSAVTDARTDIWALGVLLYEMVTGARPFSAPTTPELFSSILRDAPAPMPHGVPASLRSVILRCLDKLPERRYQHARDVRTALTTQETLKTFQPAAAVTGVLRRPSRMVFFAGVALMLAAAAGTWLGRDSGTSAPETRLTDGNRASPNSEANAYYERALLFGGVGTANPEQAQRMIERALELDPKFAAARAEYAFHHVVRILNGRSNDAALFYKGETEVRQALRDDPRCGRAHSVLAMIYFLPGRKELVPGEVDQALKENPTDPTAHSWLLHYHQFNGDYERAQEEAESLIRQWPLFWPGRLHLGQLLREQGDTAGAIREQERVLEQDSRNTDALAALTRAYIDSGDLQKADQTLDRADAQDSENYELRQMRALLLALEGKKSEAAAEVDPGLLTYSGMQVFGPAWAADFYAVMDDAGTALEWLDRAVRMGDDREEYLRRNPLLRNIRQHPRFEQILDSVAYRRQQRPTR